MQRPAFIRHTIAEILDTISELGPFLNPLVRKAGRLFGGTTGKFADLAQMIFSMVAHGLLAGILATATLYVHAYHPQYLERVPWLLRFLR